MKRAKKLTWMLGLIYIGFLGCGHAQDEENGVYYDKNAEEFSQLIEKGVAVLIDVRTPAEYAAGHIEGAVLINYNSPEFKEKINRLNKETPVLLYCRSGNRSSRAGRILEQEGFAKVYNLNGGIISWERNGYELIK